MTVSKIDPVNNYSGNNSTTTFDFDFLIENEDELLVQHTNSLGVQTTLTLGIDYTINEIGNADGSYITFPIAGSAYPVLTADEVISLTTNLDIEQTKEYKNSSGLHLSTLEWSLDYITRLIQQIARQVARSVKVQEGSSQTADQLVEALQQAQVNAANSAAAASASATSANNSAIAAGEEATIATQKAAEVDATYETAMEDIADAKTDALTSVENKKSTSIQEIEAEYEDAVASITSTKNTAKNEIQALGIYMEDDRLFYFDSDGVKHEFRNDYGGIAPMAVKHKDIQKVGNGFCLTWTDPDDSTYQENVYCTWQKTVIVRKEGSYPESPYDGTVVIENSIRNQYAKEGYIDICDNTKNYKYRAFPCSINKVYSYDNKNKFGVWVYAYTELDTESNPAKRITYLEDNEHFNPNYMDFTNDIFRYEDWENSPFYSWEYIRPCMLYTDAAGEDLKGTVMEYLDPNDHSKTIDGSPSHVADQSCNAMAMVEKRKIFTKVVVNGNSRTVYFSNEKLDDDYECYQCLREDGTYNEFYYTPMFDGALINNKLVSLAGNLTPISSKTAQDEINYARAHGNGWDTEQHPDIEFEKRAFKLLFKNTDSQSVLGQGKSNGGSSVNDCLKSGTMLTKGQNWGSSSNAQGVKFRYRENFYGSQWQRFRGMVTVNGVTKVKMTRHTGDGSTATDYNLTGEGYITLNDVPATSGTSGGYVSKTVSNKYGEFSTVVSGSSSTYLCDGRWYNNSGTMYPYRGGSSYNGLLCGAFCLSSAHAASVASWNIGAALSYKPL